jgi:hypothetical protein
LGLQAVGSFGAFYFTSLGLRALSLGMRGLSFLALGALGLRFDDLSALCGGSLARRVIPIFRRRLGAGLRYGGRFLDGRLRRSVAGHGLRFLRSAFRSGCRNWFGHWAGGSGGFGFGASLGSVVRFLLFFFWSGVYRERQKADQ